MFAAIPGFIGLIVFIAVAVLSSLLKRKQEGEFELPPDLKPRRDQPPPPQRPARNWEEQLRQLLEERAAPPPPIVEQMPAPPAPVRPMLHPTPAEEIEPHIEMSLPAPHPNVEPAFQRLPGLTQSGARYTEAATLQNRVTQHLADVTRHRVGTTSVTHGQIPAQVQEAIAAVRDPRAVRSAMLASVILGPPRAFEI